MFYVGKFACRQTDERLVGLVMDCCLFGWYSSPFIHSSSETRLLFSLVAAGEFIDTKTKWIPFHRISMAFLQNSFHMFAGDSLTRVVFLGDISAGMAHTTFMLSLFQPLRYNLFSLLYCISFEVSG